MFAAVAASQENTTKGQYCSYREFPSGMTRAEAPGGGGGGECVIIASVAEWILHS